MILEIVDFVDAVVDVVCVDVVCVDLVVDVDVVDRATTIVI